MLCKKYTILLTGLVAILLLASCARKISFQNSAVVPAARGNVKVKKDKNQNYVISVSVSNLAEVNRLQPPKETYVVWMETEERLIKNIGQIKSSAGLFSSSLKASFETVSSFKPDKIFITAENDGDAQYPGGPVVLSTNNF